MPKPESEDVVAEAVMLERRMLGMLAALTRARNVGARELDRRTGFARGSNTWSKIFRGERRLTVVHVYQALVATGVEPEDFFAAVHPRAEKPADQTSAAVTAKEVLALLRRTGSLELEIPDHRRGALRRADGR